ncbi:type-F conjugative transfer system pilin assembly protein TrbC [Kordiimonas pumila]|uniref:Type-F conjugative transfer system pilin assembly protein TrbC n=1 Tax=Kordiimonas pumila TaxID=2161677 RepID=A0ABV7D5C7_9PROT|nr:type-F conjugative transfer system pilin assembly protein TrbC [Kordiimonas pumila]
MIRYPIAALLLTVSCCSVFADDQAQERDLLKERAQELAAQTATAFKNSEIASRAREAAKTVRSEGRIELMRMMSGRVRSALGVGEDETDHILNPLETQHSSFRALVFVSSSIPLHILRRYAEQLDKVGGVMVFRGAQGGLTRFTPMVSLTKRIILQDETCSEADCKVWNVGVLIDPLLFRSNQITSVPAVTVTEDDPFSAYCERAGAESADISGPFISLGDAHLSGHLETLSRLGDPRADALLRALYQKEETP